MALLASEVTKTLEQTLSLKGLVVHSVPSDEHCLLHAIREVLCCDHHTDISMEELKATIQAELCQNFEEYKNFLTDGKLQIFDTDGKMVDSEFNPSAARDKFMKELITYFNSGTYNSDAADIIIAALCNAMSLKLVIYVSNSDGIGVLEVCHPPSRVHAHLVAHLLRSGSLNAEHYDSLVLIKVPVIQVSPEKTVPFQPVQTAPVSTTTKRKSQIKISDLFCKKSFVACSMTHSQPMSARASSSLSSSAGSQPMSARASSSLSSSAGSQTMSARASSSAGSQPMSAQASSSLSSSAGSQPMSARASSSLSSSTSLQPMSSRASLSSSSSASSQPMSDQASSSAGSQQISNRAYPAVCRSVEQFLAWQRSRTWLKMSSSGGVMCETCAHVKRLGIHTAQGQHSESAFLDGTVVSRTAKTLLKKIDKHKNSLSHCKSGEILASEKLNPITESVRTAQVLFENRNKANIETTEKLFRIAYECAKSHLPFTEYPRLVDLHRLNGVDCGSMLYSNHACANIVGHIASKMTADIVKQVVSTKSPFSLMVDESTSVSNKQSMVIYIRTEFQGEACVYFLGLVPVDIATAAGLEKTLITFCNYTGLSDDIMSKQLIGFCSDGASTMIGEHGGLAVLLKKNFH